MRRGIGVLCFPRKFLAFNAGRQAVSSFLDFLRLQEKAVLKGKRLLEMATSSPGEPLETSPVRNPFTLVGLTRNSPPKM